MKVAIIGSGGREHAICQILHKSENLTKIFCLPGNAGTAEFIFPVFYRDFAGQYSFISSILWRLSTYYPYLIAGVLLIPRWWKK